MARTKARVNRAAGLAALAAAALLVGPHSTFGLDTGAVTGTVNQVSSTTQAVVETTQQTVTTVETTVQPVEQAVETTVQQVAAPVAETVAPVTSTSPAPTAPRETSSPTRRQTSAGADSPVGRVTEQVRRVRGGAGTKVAAVTDGAKRVADRSAAATRDVRSAAGSKRGSRVAASGAAAAEGTLASCLPIEVSQVLVALDLAPIVSLLCSSVQLPARSGGPATPDGADAGGAGNPVRALADVLGVVASIVPIDPLGLVARPHMELLGERTAGGATAAVNGGGAAVAGVGAQGSTAAPLSPAHGAGRGLVVAYSERAGAASRKRAGGEDAGGGVGSRITTTGALTMILILDLALLAALLLWRGARRWVIPRLA